MSAAALAGCGSGGSHHAGTSTRARALEHEIAFGSPAVTGGKQIPGGYRCTEGRIWLPLRWGDVPAGTSELVLYVGDYGSRRAVAPGRSLALITARSLVIGIKPSLHSLAVGAPPKGTHELTRLGLPVCPPEQRGQEFVFRLYALPRRQRVDPDALARQSPSALMEAIGRKPLAIGLFTADSGSA